jgi:hypothetical protein
VQQIMAALLLKDDQIKTEHDEVMAVSHAKTILEVLCFFCDAKGHYKSDCPEWKAWEKSKLKKTSTAAGVWESSDDKAFWLQGCYLFSGRRYTHRGVLESQAHRRVSPFRDASV